MKALLIVDCTDSMLWYAEHIGEVVPFLREFEDCYMSRERTGYSNIVYKKDAMFVEVPEDSALFQLIKKWL